MGCAWRTRKGTKSLGRATAAAPLTPPAPAATPGTSSPQHGDPSEIIFISKFNSAFRTQISRFYFPPESSQLNMKLDNRPKLPIVGNWELCWVLQDCWPDCRQGGRGGGGRGCHGRRPEDGRDNPLYQVLYGNFSFWICHWRFKGLGKSVEY